MEEGAVARLARRAGGKRATRPTVVWELADAEVDEDLVSLHLAPKKKGAATAIAAALAGPGTPGGAAASGALTGAPVASPSSAKKVRASSLFFPPSHVYPARSPACPPRAWYPFDLI